MPRKKKGDRYPACAPIVAMPRRGDWREPLLPPIPDRTCPPWPAAHAASPSRHPAPLHRPNSRHFQSDGRPAVSRCALPARRSGPEPPSPVLLLSARAVFCSCSSAHAGIHIAARRLHTTIYVYKVVFLYFIHMCTHFETHRKKHFFIFLTMCTFRLFRLMQE